VVEWAPKGCRHLTYDYAGGVNLVGECKNLSLTVQNPSDLGWTVERTRGVRLWEPGTDRVGLIFIRKEEVESPPQGVGPNPIISGPEVATSPMETTRNTVTPSLDRTGELPLWKVMQATYDALNQTNLNLTTHCWLYYDVKPPFYEAIGVNTTYNLDT